MAAIRIVKVHEDGKFSLPYEPGTIKFCGVVAKCLQALGEVWPELEKAVTGTGPQGYFKNHSLFCILSLIVIFTFHSHNIHTLLVNYKLPHVSQWWRTYDNIFFLSLISKSKLIISLPGISIAFCIISLKQKICFSFRSRFLEAIESQTESKDWYP